MHSYLILAATLLASPLVSAQGKVEVDMRALANLEEALYNLQSSMKVTGANVDPNAPSSCTNTDQICKDKNFKNFTGCWQNCVSSQATDNPLAGNCARFCTSKCGCDKSKDPYWGVPDENQEGLRPVGSTGVSADGTPEVVVDTIETNVPPTTNGVPNVVVDTVPVNGNNNNDRPDVVVDTIPVVEGSDDLLSNNNANDDDDRDRTSTTSSGRITPTNAPTVVVDTVPVRAGLNRMLGVGADLLRPQGSTGRRIEEPQEPRRRRRV